MTLKNLISSPLEAGQSVLDAHRLPSHLDAALEYTARRLARKSLSIDLVVVRREYQLPQAAAGACHDEHLPSRPGEADARAMKPLPPLPPLPSASRFASAFKGLVRSSTVPSLASLTPASTSTSAPAVASPKRADGGSRWPFSPCRSLSSASAASSPSFSSLSSTTASSFAFPMSSPLTPATPVTPATPSTVASADSLSTTTTSSSLHSQPSASQSHHASASRLPPSSFGLRLVHTDSLPRAHKRVLVHILTKAAHRFRLPHNWLPPPVHASELGLPLGLVSRSLQQNQILFQGGGDDHSFPAVRPPDSLVLRSLDHLYTFKAALCSYAQTGDRHRLEDAVDELRRYILLRLGGPSNKPHRRALSKRELLQQYPELSCFTDTHIVAVNRMYSRAYGGPEHECGIEADDLSLCPPPPPPPPSSGTDSTSGNDDEQSTPTATTMDTSRAWTRPLLQASSTLPVPILGMTRRMRRPTGMVFASPTAGAEPIAADSAPSTASSLSSSSVLSTPSSLPSLSLSLGSSVSQLSEDNEMGGPDQEQQAQDRTAPATHKVPVLQAEETVSPMAPVDVEAAVSQAVPLPAPTLTSTTTMTTTTTIVIRPTARSLAPTLPLPRSPTSPSTRLPVLKLQTTFERPREKTKKPAAEKDDDDEEQLTARPVSCVRRTFLFGGGGGGLGSSIGEVLGDFSVNGGGRKRKSADTVLTLVSPLSGAGDDPVSAGPVPPRSYDDISPITRSEWGFLKGDLMGRQVTVTTF